MMRTRVLQFQSKVFWVLYLGCFLGCATRAERPCTDGGVAPWSTGEPGKGSKKCQQVQGPDGKFINEGRYVEWHPNGVRAIEGEYVRGLKTGKWTEWDDTGKKLAERWYEQGRETPNRDEKTQALEKAVPPPLIFKPGFKDPQPATGPEPKK